jgi:hypothetical protein
MSFPSCLARLTYFTICFALSTMAMDTHAFRWSRDYLFLVSIRFLFHMPDLLRDCLCEHFSTRRFSLSPFCFRLFYELCPSLLSLRDNLFFDDLLKSVMDLLPLELLLFL